MKYIYYISILLTLVLAGCSGVAAPEPKFLEDLVEDARDLHLDVRVIPQLHRVLSIP